MFEVKIEKTDSFKDIKALLKHIVDNEQVENVLGVNATKIKAEVDQDQLLNIMADLVEYAIQSDSAYGLENFMGYITLERNLDDGHTTLRNMLDQAKKEEPKKYFVVFELTDLMTPWSISNVFSIETLDDLENAKDSLNFTATEMGCTVNGAVVEVAVVDGGGFDMQNVRYHKQVGDEWHRVATKFLDSYLK